MDTIYCAQSAFKFFRTPPQVLALLPEIPIARDRGTRMGLRHNAMVQNALGLPMHTLVFEDSQRTNAKFTKQHLWTKELPAEALIEDTPVGTVTSPLFTLFTMATSVDAAELAMAMHELCGEFAVYEPSREVEEALGQAPGLHGWRRVVDDAGNPTSLWQRPALVQPHEIAAYADRMAGYRGCKTFRQAAQMVLGATLSPFEVQAAMLLGLPRRLGGYGFSVQTNKAIPLTGAARKLAGRDYCVADIYIESKDAKLAVDVECQGAAVHSSLGAAASDADRTCALESMGIEVVLLSYAQMFDPERFGIVADLIARKLKEPLAPKTERMDAAEKALRRQLFIDWRGLCGVK